MTMTNLNMTKEEIIYNFIIAINKGPAGGDPSSEIVCKAINEYNKLIEEGIIIEEDAENKLNEIFNRSRGGDNSWGINTGKPALDILDENFNNEYIHDYTYKSIYPESDVRY